MNLEQKLSEKQPNIIEHLHHQKIYFFVCMYKMSSEAERLTKERKIDVKTYTKNKIRTIRVNKKDVNGLYVIREKMIDLQKGLVYRNLYHVAMKKIDSYCGTKHSTKEQFKKYKRKMSQWINDETCVYIREDLVHNLIRYINLDVIEIDEMRKILVLRIVNQFK